MGEVYRATDTRLKRQVAVKILPPALAADPDQLARFQREAEVLASLNHPQIAAVYGLDGLIVLAAHDWVGVAIHTVVLVMMVRGLDAGRRRS